VLDRGRLNEENVGEVAGEDLRRTTGALDEDLVVLGGDRLGRDDKGAAHGSEQNVGVVYRHQLLVLAHSRVGQAVVVVLDDLDLAAVDPTVCVHDAFPDLVTVVAVGPDVGLVAGEWF